MSLNSMIGALNTSIGNDYVFGGANTDVTPINNFGAKHRQLNIQPNLRLTIS